MSVYKKKSGKKCGEYMPKPPIPVKNNSSEHGRSTLNPTVTQITPTKNIEPTPETKTGRSTPHPSEKSQNQKMSTESNPPSPNKNTKREKTEPNNGNAIMLKDSDENKSDKSNPIPPDKNGSALLFTSPCVVFVYCFVFINKCINVSLYKASA